MKTSVLRTTKAAPFVCYLGMCLVGLTLGASATVLAQQATANAAPPTVKWTAQDTRGQQLAIPAADRSTVVLFVRGDQPQSKQAIQQAKTVLKSQDAVQAIVVLSGQQDAQAPATTAANLGWTGPIVLDLDYAASGRLGVHVWPTTVVVSANGQQVAHLPGISSSFSTQLDAYLAFAAGKIDRNELTKRLGATDVVGDTAEQMAARHLQVAQRLMEKGLLDQAQAEIAEGLKRQPRNASLRLVLARILLRQGEIKQAQALIENFGADEIPAWQRSLLRGQLLLANKQWDAALPLLQEALKLNPDPAETQYELGRVYSQKGDWQHASEAFKAAFEATATGRSLTTASK